MLHRREDRPSEGRGEGRSGEKRGWMDGSSVDSRDDAGYLRRARFA